MYHFNPPIHSIAFSVSDFRLIPVYYLVKSRVVNFPEIWYQAEMSKKISLIVNIANYLRISVDLNISMRPCMQCLWAQL